MVISELENSTKGTKILSYNCSCCINVYHIFWLKRSGLGSTQYFAGVGGSGAYASAVYFDSNDQLETWNYFNSSYAGRYKTNRKFR